MSDRPPPPYVVSVHPSKAIPFGYLATVSPGTHFDRWRPTARWAHHAGVAYARRFARRKAHAKRWGAGS